MQDFTFHNPTKIIFGFEAELNIVADMKESGYHKVMVVYGREHIKKSGLYDRVVRRLIKNELNFTDFEGVKPNPILGHAKEAVDWARKNQVDCILAIGGGSVIDEAKAIAAGFYYEGDLWDLYEGKAEVANALPIFAILTLAATGSEMNPTSVLTNERENKKYALSSHLLYPKASALNPALTLSVDKKQSAIAAADAFCHILESYLNKKNDFRLQDRLCEALFRTVIETSDRIQKNQGDYDARASFMWSACLALNGTVLMGAKEVSFPNHLIEHSLSAMFDIPHGEGLAIVMPAWLTWFAAKEPKRVERFCKKIFKKNIPEGVAALEAWLRDMGLATSLEDVGIDESKIPDIVSNILVSAKRSALYKEYDKKALECILRNALQSEVQKRFKRADKSLF